MCSSDLVDLLHVLELPPELQAVSARGETDIYQIRAAADADILRRRISEKWRTNDVDPLVRNAKVATVSFDILRNGQVQNVKIVQSSGIPTLDYSARRAVLEASPLPELPREFERSSANVEFTFQLQR